MHGKDHYHSAWESVVYSIQVSEKPYLPQIEETSKKPIPEVPLYYGRNGNGQCVPGLVQRLER